MNIPTLRFSGIYLKEVRQEEQGIGSLTNFLTVSVTNDANGNHLEKYGTIVGDSQYGDYYYRLAGEKVFKYESHEDGYGGSYTHFKAGDDLIDMTDASKKGLVLSLIGELNQLHPKFKEWMKGNT